MLTQKSKSWIGGAGMVLVPFLLMVGCLAVNHFFDSFDRYGGYSIVISIIGGLLFVWVLPLRAFWRFLITIAYIPALVYPLLLFQFFAAVVFFGLRF
jgi:hypothetical protein